MNIDLAWAMPSARATHERSMFHVSVLRMSVAIAGGHRGTI